MSVFAVAALSGQVAAITRMPEQFERVACWAMSLLWLAATALVVRLAGLHAPATSDSQARTTPKPVAAPEYDRHPSRQMLAAWLMARDGSGTDVVAHVAQVPHALAELIVADALSDSDEQA